MCKKVTEDLVKEKVAELLKDRHWRRVCLLVLLLLPRGKLASRYFIYNKIEEWGLWSLSCNREIDNIIDDKVNALAVISKTLYGLFLDGFLRKEDLSRLSAKKFEKICEERVLGRRKQREIEFNIRWVQSVFHLSPGGRTLAKATLFPPRKKMSFFNFFKLKKRGGNQNFTCA